MGAHSLCWFCHEAAHFPLFVSRASVVYDISKTFVQMFTFLHFTLQFYMFSLELAVLVRAFGNKTALIRSGFKSFLANNFGV